ncbi:hypothetical protein EDC59_101410 [Pseudodesulfovibrio indicus]|uniref:Uncharacterized protein n=2 Tax=Pseudodesulfovibrio indicus TaxID=1716143 RepID=A0A126QM88_9BACT|nr:hypothetical protein AWY79_07705 [Pseudodesulfovibrio indicus]TDT92006.1 hypothetical protein EDC59_101410 [Pseudodesulfovibrio indicus]
MTKGDNVNVIGTVGLPSDSDKGRERMKWAKRIGCRENGEIDTSDAFQVEIICSWPALFRAPEEIAGQINRDAGFLRIATPGMPMDEWAHRVNGYKGLGLIPGPIRQRDLHWDGQDITRLIDKLCRILEFGTADLTNLPGYDPRLPGVLTCDVAGFCLIDPKEYGRTPRALIGNIAHIDNLRLASETPPAQRRRSPIRTPATVARLGIELYGTENLPEKTAHSKRIPNNGCCRISTHCLFCGTPVKVRGMVIDNRPHFELDTQPTCNHLRLRIKPTSNGEHHELHVIHEQQSESQTGGTEADQRHEAGD